MSTVNELLIAIASRSFNQDYIKDDIQFVNECFNTLRKYQNAVYDHVYNTSTLYTLMQNDSIDANEFKEKAEEYDKTRTMIHNRAIDACNQINRMCELHGLEYLCPVPVFEDDKCINRGDIADFIGRYVNEVFQYGRSGQELAPIDITNEIKYGTNKQEYRNQAAYEEFDGYDFEPGGN